MAFVNFNLLSSGEIKIGKVNLSIVPLRMPSLSGRLLKGRKEQDRIVEKPAYYMEAFLEQRIDECLVLEVVAVGLI